LALQKPNLSLDQLLEKARAFEAVHHHVNDVDGKSKKAVVMLTESVEKSGSENKMYGNSPINR